MSVVDRSGNGSGVNFAIVGEGSDARIFAFASLSTVTASTSSVESLKKDNNNTKSWKCKKCSYENADSGISLCSICGSAKDKTDKPRKSVRYQFAKELSLSVESLMEAADSRPETNIAQGGLDSKFEKELMMSFANWSLCDKEGWICPSCTYFNQNSLHLTCDICEQVRPQKESTDEVPTQRSLQEFMNSSLPKLGQDDYLQKQREKFLQLEERALEDERMKEITEIQRELFAKIEQERDNQKTVKADRNETKQDGLQLADKDGEAAAIVGECLSGIEEAKRVLERTQERIMRLESIRQQQMDEQKKMEEQLQLQMEMLKKANERSDTGTASAEHIAQQKMLEFWKEEFVNREKRMAEIRAQQDELLRKLQER